MAQDKLAYLLKGKPARNMDSYDLSKVKTKVRLYKDRERSMQAMLDAVRPYLPEEVIIYLEATDYAYEILDGYEGCEYASKYDLIHEMADSFSNWGPYSIDYNELDKAILRGCGYRLFEKPESDYTIMDTVHLKWGIDVPEEIAQFLILNFDREDYKYRKVEYSPNFVSNVKKLMSYGEMLDEDLESFKKCDGYYLDDVISKLINELSSKEFAEFETDNPKVLKVLNLLKDSPITRAILDDKELINFILSHDKLTHMLTSLLENNMHELLTEDYILRTYRLLKVYEQKDIYSSLEAAVTDIILYNIDYRDKYLSIVVLNKMICSIFNNSLMPKSTSFKELFKENISNKIETHESMIKYLKGFESNISTAIRDISNIEISEKYKYDFKSKSKNMKVLNYNYEDLRVLINDYNIDRDDIDTAIQYLSAAKYKINSEVYTRILKASDLRSIVKFLNMYNINFSDIITDDNCYSTKFFNELCYKLIKGVPRTEVFKSGDNIYLECANRMDKAGIDKSEVISKYGNIYAAYLAIFHNKNILNKIKDLKSLRIVCREVFETTTTTINEKYMDVKNRLEKLGYSTEDISLKYSDVNNAYMSLVLDFDILQKLDNKTCTKIINDSIRYHDRLNYLVRVYSIDSSILKQCMEHYIYLQEFDGKDYIDGINIAVPIEDYPTINSLAYITDYYDVMENYGCSGFKFKNDNNYHDLSKFCKNILELVKKGRCVKYVEDFNGLDEYPKTFCYAPHKEIFEQYALLNGWTEDSEMTLMDYCNLFIPEEYQSFEAYEDKLDFVLNEIKESKKLDEEIVIDEDLYSYFVKCLPFNFLKEASMEECLQKYKEQYMDNPYASKSDIIMDLKANYA